ncbi:unnamed protein product [Trichogramma brassicae]|uniref:Uncharacterized protein n=1 Tax=Trichogramma brassicae TaxID=86971 RepID=A0A6H5HX05_9HYME|nr:unnamed protein product [Trichogramma brassicae]
MPQRGAGCSRGTAVEPGRCPTRGQWLERQPPRDRNEDEDILNLDTERDELEEAGGRSSPHLDRTIYFDDPTDRQRVAYRRYHIGWRPSSARRETRAHAVCCCSPRPIGKTTAASTS